MELEDDIKIKLKKYQNAKIDYIEFQKLKNEYAPQLDDESEFAQILGISKSSFHNLKYRKGAKVIILKNDNLLEENREEILEKLSQYRNSYITYQSFCDLYNQFGQNVPKYKFANFLGISNANFNSMRQRNTKAKILADSGKDEIIKKIKEEIIANERIRNIRISYDTFKKLYEKYKPKYRGLFVQIYGREEELEEIEFAHILDISSASYWDMVNRGINTTALKKSLSEMVDEIKAKKEEIKKNNPKIRMIVYEQLQKIYELYGKDLDERTFATEVLGIGESSYDHMKNNKWLRARVDFNRKKRYKVENIKKQNRFYSIEEINEIIKQNDVNLDDFIAYIFHLKEESELVEEYKEVLKSKKKLYIGSTVISKEFLEKNASELLKIVRTQSKMYGVKYNAIRFYDDVASEVLLVLMEKYGEITYNFDEEKALKILTKIANIATRYNYFKKFNIRRLISLDDLVTDKNGKKRKNDRLLAKVCEEIENEDDDFLIDI